MYKTDHRIGPYEVTCEHCLTVLSIAAQFARAIAQIMIMYDSMEVTGEA